MKYSILIILTFISLHSFAGKAKPLSFKEAKDMGVKVAVRESTWASCYDVYFEGPESITEEERSYPRLGVIYSVLDPEKEKYILYIKGKVEQRSSTACISKEYLRNLQLTFSYNLPKAEGDLICPPSFRLEGFHKLVGK